MVDEETDVSETPAETAPTPAPPKKKAAPKGRAKTRSRSAKPRKAKTQGGEEIATVTLPLKPVARTQNHPDNAE